MKKVLPLLITAVTALSLFVIIPGCNSQINVSSPEISLAPGETTISSIAFNITTANATNAAYMVLADDSNIPDSDEILANGTSVETGKTVTETVADLEPATEYTIVATAENEGGILKNPAILKISTKSDLGSDIVSEHTDLWWYGPQSDTGSDQFCLQLSTAEVDEAIMPLEGGELVRLYMFTTSKGKDVDPVLTPGTYTLGTEGGFTPMTIDPAASVYAKGTNAEDWKQFFIESCEVTVEYNEGTYNITANLVINDGNSTKIRARYSGEVRLTDCSDGFRHFIDDKTETMIGMTGAISTSSAAPGLDVYTIAIYNCGLDESGFIVGEGYVFNCDLYIKSAPYEEYDFSGTFAPNTEWTEGVYPENTFISGFVYDMYGMLVPAGTYLAQYNDDGQLVAAGLAQDGEIIISRSNGNCTINANLVTDKGAKLNITYDGPDTPLANYKDLAGELPKASKIPEAFPWGAPVLR